ncbi:MAG: MFS transporter, partial [Planctomycetaceae bacterium]|nr:MFS transporter [Planctomycetaceae bacterium]
GGGGILLGLVLMWMLREPARNQAERLAASEAGLESAEQHVPWLQFVVSTLSSPASACLLLAFVGANTVAAILYAWLTTYVMRKFEIGLGYSGVIGTVPIQVGAILGAIAGGVLADRFRQRWLGGRAGVQALGILGGIPMLLLCTLPGSLPLVVVGLSLLGVCKGMYDSNIWPAIYEVVPAARRSSAVGLANLVGWSGGGVGAWLLGRAVDKGTPMSEALAYTAVIYAVVALLLIASALLFTPRHIRREQARLDAAAG